MRLVLPEAVWHSLLDEFERQPPEVERIAFLDGYRVGNIAVVTTLTVPDATCTPGYYTVTSDQMREAGAHFRRYNMVRLAQVHTHGGPDLAHSCRDDKMAYSQKPGSLSLVLPDHVKGRPAPLDGLLHLKSGEQWLAVGVDEAARLISVVPSVLDYRRSTWTPSHRGMKEILVVAWNRLTKSVSSLFRSTSRRT